MRSAQDPLEKAIRSTTQHESVLIRIILRLAEPRNWKGEDLGAGVDFAIQYQNHKLHVWNFNFASQKGRWWRGGARFRTSHPFMMFDKRISAHVSQSLKYHSDVYSWFCSCLRNETIHVCYCMLPSDLPSASEFRSILSHVQDYKIWH